MVSKKDLDIVAVLTKKDLDDPTPAPPAPGRRLRNPASSSEGGRSMKHVVRVQMSGTRDGQEWPAVGEHIDLSPDEAAHLVANGTVEAAAAAPPAAARPVPETATAPKPETRSSGRRKTGG